MQIHSISHILLDCIIPPPPQIADLQSSDSKGRDLKWVEGFHIGSTIEGKIQESKEFGVVVSFEKHNDVFGFVSHHQCKLFISFHYHVNAFLDVCCFINIYELLILSL